MHVKRGMRIEQVEGLYEAGRVDIKIGTCPAMPVAFATEGQCTLIFVPIFMSQGSEDSSSLGLRAI